MGSCPGETEKEMKISFTVNLQNYESFHIDSNEHDSVKACLSEIYEQLVLIQHKEIQRFLEAFYKTAIQLPIKQSKN